MDTRKEKTREAYNAIASIYEEDFGKDREYFNLFILPILFDIRKHHLAGPIVDLGSGPGNVVDYLVENEVENQIIAVDFAAKFCELLQEKFQETPKVKVAESDMIQFVANQPPDSIAAYIANYSLIHVPDESFDELLRSMYQTLEIGGYLAFAVWGGIKKQMEPVPYQVQSDLRLQSETVLESYMNNFTVDELRGRLTHAGFVDIFLKTFKTDPLPGEFDQPKIIGYAKKFFASNN
jgi:SAM-dependent methyltransferase